MPASTTISFPALCSSGSQRIPEGISLEMGENHLQTERTGNERDDAFRRWHKITIDHFSYVQNLILTFTVAGLGYWFALLRDHNFLPGSSAKCAMILAFSTLSMSVLCGLICAVNRLWDFRGTARRASDRSDKPTKAHLDALGRLTWVLFYIQLAAFAGGIAAIAMAVLLTSGAKVV